jgi:hypothetical protein
MNPLFDQATPFSCQIQNHLTTIISSALRGHLQLD